MSPFDEDPADERSEIDQCVDEIKRLQGELVLCASRNTAAIKALLSERNELLKTVQLVYRKHCMDYDGIGWDELGGVLLDTLCNIMGNEGYEEWKNELKGKI